MFTSLAWAGSLPNGTSGQRYSQTVGSLALEVGENSSTYAWAFVGAAPWAGAGLSATLFGVGGGSVVCTLTGTPSSTGTKTFTVKVRHIASGSEQTHQFSVYIAAAAPPDGDDWVVRSTGTFTGTVGTVINMNLGYYAPRTAPKPTLASDVSLHFNAQPNITLSERGWELGLTGTPTSILTGTVSFSVKRPDGSVVDSWTRPIAIAASATPPVTVTVTAYTAPAMTVGTQYQYTVGQVIQPTATAAQAVWTLDSAHADYARLPAGTSMTTAGKLTIRPANPTDLKVPVRVTVPHPTAGQAALIYTGLFPITDITAATPNPSVKATLNSFPQATVGVAYSSTVGTITLPSSGGTWSLADRGTLPSGATLSSAGVLATTFTEAGTKTAQVKASATGYLQALYPISITVVAAPGVGEIVYSLNALANATVGVAYSATLGTVSTPASGATWSFASRGNLPSGAALSSAGVLTATFPTVQSYIFTAKISASGYTDRSVPIAVQCVGLPAIVLQRAASTAFFVNQSLVGAALVWAEIPSSGMTYTITSRGDLPATVGISHTSQYCYLSGSSAIDGTFSFKIKASATGYASREDGYSITIHPQPPQPPIIKVTWADLPKAVEATAYSQSLGTVTAPATGTVWTLTDHGNLPGTETLTTAGVLSIPSPATGIYRFGVTLTASGYADLVHTLSVTVSDNTIVLQKRPLDPAIRQVVFSQSIATVTLPVSGATFSLSDRNNLPVTVDLSEGGLLMGSFGEYAVLGPYLFKAEVAAAGYDTREDEYLISLVSAMSVQVAWNAFPPAAANVAYSQTLGVATQPASGATWTLSSRGDLPLTATLSGAGVLATTLPTAKIYRFTVTIAATGYTSLVQAIELPCGENSKAVKVTQPTYPNATVNVAYTASLGTVSDPPSGATWTLSTRGTLPAGATVSSTGQLSATFAAVGSYQGTVTVSASGYVSTTLTVKITAVASGGTGTIAVTMASLPNAAPNVAYSQQLGTVTTPASGATWSLASIGTLPSTATLTPGGQLSCTFANTGTFTATVKISANGYTPITRSISVTVAALSNQTMQLKFLQMPDGVVGEAYERGFLKVYEPETFSLSLTNAGTLPGASVSTSSYGTGILTCSAFSTAGTYEFTVQVTASGYTTVNQTWQLTVVAETPEPPSTVDVDWNTAAFNATVGEQKAFFLGSVVQPASGMTWTISDEGGWPDTVEITTTPDATDGTLTSWWPFPGSHQGTVTVSASGMTSASHAFYVHVSPKVTLPPVIVDPPDPPPSGGGGGGGGGDPPPPPPPPPPPVIDDLGATWVVRHTARDDGQGGLAPTLNSLGTVDYGAGHLYFPPTFNYVVKRWSVPNAGGTGEWVYQEIPDTFGNGSEVTVSYVPDSVEPEEVTAYLPPPQLEVDLTPFTADAVIPGSVKFTIGSAVFQDYEGVVVMNPDANGVGTEAGTISYQTGKVVLHTWQAGDKTFALQALATVSGRYTDTAMRFRVASAPLRPSGFTVAATALDGELLSGSVDLLGVITGNAIAGTLDTEYGLCNLLFGDYVLDSTLTDAQKAEEWYDAGDVLPNGTIWQPRKVFPSSVRYNAVAYTSIPVSADILGLDPVRLPSDGRVPIFVKGQLALVHQTSSLIENTLSPTQVLDTGEERLYRVALTDALGQLIGADQYVLDRAAGTVTMNANWSSAPYTAPFTLRYTIADLRIISAVDLSGKITFNRALSHAYAQDDAKLSGVLYLGTLQARVTNVFTQAAWTGEWQDTVIGTPPLARYNDVQYPVQVNNRNAYPDRFLIKFTSATEFQVIGENLGVIGTGSIAQDCSPVNTLTGYAYFTIPYQGWGVGWATGNCVRFNVVGACYPVDCARAIQPSEPSSLPDGATLLLIGNVDA